MARLLHRLGRFSARRAWYVLGSWLVVLALGAGAYLAFGGALSSNFNIPGTATQQVTDRLADELPDLAGSSATVVFQTDDGAFTAEQRTEIGELLQDIGTVDGVVRTIDPFTTEQQLADQASQLDDGKARLEASRTRLDDGQRQLDAAVAAAKADGTYPYAEAGLAEQQATIDDGRRQLAEGQAQLDVGERLLSDARAAAHQVSADGDTALGTVVFDQDFFTLSQTTKDAVIAKLDGARLDGVTTHYSSTIASTLDGLIGPGEITGVVLALLVLLVMLRAILPALLPIITSLLGVGSGIAIAMAFSGVVQMSSVTPALGLMLGLAVGIDYALFIVNRHRRELRHGVELHESIGLANGTAGSAVVFAGATVVVALLGLLLTGVPFLGTMGVVAAFCVAVAVLMAVTVVPALLRLIGPRALDRWSRRRPQALPRTAPKPMRTWRAIVSLVAGIAALLVIATPALSMRLALLNDASEATTSEQYQTFKIVEQEFGAGRNSPLVVVADLAQPVPAGTASADGTASDTALLAEEADLADFLMARAHVSAVVPVGTDAARDLIAFQLIPDSGSTSVEVESLVHDLRTVAPPSGVTALGVAGSASAAMDISAKLADALPLYLGVIVVIAIVLLIGVFRSILVPVVAAAGFVLSLFAALGVITAVYQWGWLGALFGVHDPGPVLAFAPILVLGMLFGLAMDYQLFLVTGMREAYVHGAPARVAVMSGLRGGRAVVTAAAIIMASVFGGFVFSEMGMIRPLGMGLAVGVLFDAFVVRMLIVPAVMHLLGRAAWWLPRWLDRLIPDIDVEGAALEREHHL